MQEGLCEPLRSDNSESVLNVVSKITTEFNERFKEFIKKLKRNVDVEALALKDTYMLMPIQKDIREYIIENQSEFDLVDRKKITENNHPNIFAIMICVIIHSLNEYSSFQEILDESQKYRWEIGMHSSNDPNDTGYANSYGEQNFRCACNTSCSPENMFLISNLETGMNIAVGCECITKTKFIEPHELKELEKKSKNDPHYIEIARVRHIKKMNEGLSKNKTTKTIESVNKNYSYVGGNFGEHKNVANLYFAIENTKKKSNYRIEDFAVDCCKVCLQKNIKDNIFIAKIPDNPKKDVVVKAICKTCIEHLTIKIKRKGVCDDCGETHRNKNNNYCNDCRRKKCCDGCLMRKNIYCKGRCFECSFLNYCKICDKVKVDKAGFACSACYNRHAKVCESRDCNKIVVHPKYKKCYSCNFGNN